RVGSNQYAFNILTKLQFLDQKNQYLVYLKHPPLSDLPKSNHRWQYRVIKSTPLWTQWRLPLDLYLKKPKPDLFLTLGHYAPKFAPMPTLVTILDLAFIFFPNTYLKKDLFKLKNWTKSSVKKARHIFTISNSSKKDIQKYYQVSPEKITVVYPGIDHQRFEKKSTTSLISGDYLLYLGTLQPRKNLENLVLAYSKLPDKLKTNKLVIAGKKGWLYKPLFKLVKQLKLENHVIFTDYVLSKDLPGLIQQAKLLILPSFYEGFGIPVVQAMAAQTPVLVSKNSSLKEIVKSHGFYIKEPFQSQQVKQGIIQALTSKPNLKAAQAHAKHFSWHQSAENILEVINGIDI
ncbi:MAG: glycosyltransferase family 1 protein, partial [Candidatus Beckwithbacteria bacterium]